MKFRAPSHPVCRGTGVKLQSIGLDERGKTWEGTKEYRCHECGRWLRPSNLETLPYHHRHGEPKG